MKLEATIKLRSHDLQLNLAWGLVQKRTSMFISFYGLLEAGLLVLNGIAVLNKERFLNKVGLSVPSNSFQVANPSSFKMQVVNLIAAIQTVMRVPLIAINIFVIIAKLLFG
ncbi:Immediate early response 3-interacting protein [Dirofilaria immitis]